ncbi:MAG: hypothetical protein RLZZ595_1849 [Bacteroidota bacterium]|jgi:type IV secretory pathway component VirB8
MDNNKLKSSIAIVLFFLGAVFSCNTPEGFKEPEDPLDAGREFVRSVLDADYEKAALYLSKDAEDQELFNRYQSYMKKRPKKEMLQLKSSSIIINKVETLSDSVTIINYSNSHTMKPTDLKVVKDGKTWKVDFSYTFSGNLPVE